MVGGNVYMGAHDVVHARVSAQKKLDARDELASGAVGRHRSTLG